VAVAGEAAPPVAPAGPESLALDGDDRRALDEPVLGPRGFDGASALPGRDPDTSVSDATAFDATRGTDATRTTDAARGTDATRTTDAARGTDTARATGTLSSTGTVSSTDGARATRTAGPAADVRTDPEPAGTTAEPATRVPRSRGAEKVQVETARPSPVSRSGQRAGARR
jgi:hypothetical protein